MIETYLLSRPWLVALIWIVIYTGDYYLTIIGVGAYRRQRVFEFEGSYELTPQFQKDINQGTLFSKTFLTWLLCGVVFLLAAGYLSRLFDCRYVYGVAVGSVVFESLATYVRHIPNIERFRSIARGAPGVSGHVVTSKEFSYRQSATQFACLSVYTLVAFVLTGSPILLGGSIGLLYGAWEHVRLARHYKRVGETPERSEETACEDSTSRRSGGCPR